MVPSTSHSQHNAFPAYDVPDDFIDDRSYAFWTKRLCILTVIATYLHYLESPHAMAVELHCSPPSAELWNSSQ